jgi:excisionase family DNA binding protein
MSDDTYITVEAAADILQLSTRQTHRYAKGTPPRLRTSRSGKRFLFHQGDVRRLAEELASGQVDTYRARKATSELPQSVFSMDRPDLLTVGELISLRQAAEYAGLTKETLRNYVRRGRLRSRKLGSQWVTTRAAVDEYLSSRKLEHIPKIHR